MLVRDEVDGDIVLGPTGIHHLADGRVEGDDPLAVFGPNTADHLRRTSAFDNCPDLLINSFYDPVTDEGAAFEELIGFHGGLGGRQSHPFILAPAGLTAPRNRSSVRDRSTNCSRPGSPSADTATESRRAEPSRHDPVRPTVAEWVRPTPQREPRGSAGTTLAGGAAAAVSTFRPAPRPTRCRVVAL